MNFPARPLLRALGMIPLLASTPAPTAGQARPLGDFQDHGDIGPVNRPGSAVYDPVRQAYTVTAAGANMWSDHDELHYVWRRMSGDFVVRARVDLIGRGVDPHRKAGWSVRAGLDPAAAHVTAAVHGDGLAALQFRRTGGGQTEEVRSPVAAPDVVQLERRGDTLIMSVARHGEPLAHQQVSQVALGEEVYVGLFVCAHNDHVVERAHFRDVRVIVPAPDDFVPYRDYLGSNVEVVDVLTGDRTVVHRSPGSLQAPNWTPDGAALIYNQDGRLFRFDLERRAPELIDTGFATRNNNDHVLSFDGRTIGISNASPEENQSVVYTVPIQGGTPRRVTPRAPSYLHGWSPDGRYLLYTGGRDGEFDIYRIPVEGGEEVRLTDAPGLDDGSEYTPDGRYIYFNSVRSGRMQIWRMRPDGSRQEQVTDDGFNNWFPHVSPDGRWIVFLSYLPDVEPGDHPWYRHVYLRIMPLEGGAPRVLAYVYGGQGTINVPSWSPDSKRVAFVSNTGPLR